MLDSINYVECIMLTLGMSRFDFSLLADVDEEQNEPVDLPAINK